jgi:hypothetical protein
MALLPLSRACRAACERLPEDFAHMHGQIAALYAAHDRAPLPSLAQECALFLHWSIEIGLLNARGSGMDRWLATRRFERSLREMADRLPIAPLHGAGTAGAVYRQRYREVLPRIRNIYIGGDEGHGLELPLTLRAAAFFLTRTAEPSGASPEPLKTELFGLLRSICAGLAMPMLGKADDWKSPVDKASGNISPSAYL